MAKKAVFLWKDAWAVGLALAGLGVGWMASHESAVIAGVVLAVTYWVVPLILGWR